MNRVLEVSEFIRASPKGIADFTRYTTLSDNWHFSLGVLEQLRGKLRDRLSDNVESIALAGSFGRLEGSKASDADYISVVRDSAPAATDADDRIIRTAIQEIGVSPPNKRGVFAHPRTRAELIDTTGHENEESDVLGKRLLLLLESRPIYGDTAFVSVLDAIFERYTRHNSGEPAKELTFLLNDLIRYFRYICVNYESSFWRETEKWALRNLKLRHSRVLMYAGLLFLLGEASKKKGQHKTDFVWNGLTLSPLERIASVYEANNDPSFFRVAGLYNVFLAHLSDPDLRQRLAPVEYQDRYSQPEFAELKANSDAFAAELLRFVLARRGVWTERFFEYLIL